MRVEKLVLRNFRNYVHLQLKLTQNINIFIGNNAQGKTNILEAIYLAAMGRSHRTNVDSEMIRWQEPDSMVDILFSRQNVENRLVFHFINNQNKEILLNEGKVKLRDVIGSFNAVLFSPEDLTLIKGMPAERRRFLDVEISQANPAYYRQLTHYTRILMQRNNLLKKIRENKAKADLLDPWDEQLSQGAAFIVRKRQEAVKKLTMLANLMHRRLTANRESLALAYNQHGCEKPITTDLAVWYRQELVSQRGNDIFRGSTGVGPHRDDLLLTVNGVNLRTYGSQGQQRTGVLALKLAELEFIKSETGEYPVLLLDDVMSELDAVRREQLLLFIRDKIQTFITATEEKYFPEWRFGKYYHVINGTVTE
ncbi:recf protein signature 2 [Lucifera butyrica]|uniref:DNA replication and repair protein RecF n=1 Tax=Lucifera butyrica TaxID=1351585 RepID=A0A498R462_9FIRM|nr:DNA replication/repair protein RecF [Lucifera butyrica]VBB07476.1 recf protein signature 2 [Lucifera butyrica]